MGGWVTFLYHWVSIIKPNKHNIMKTKFLIPLIAGLGLLCACKGKGGAGTGYEAINNSATTDSTKLDSASLAQTKLVKTAGIRIKVKNVQQTSEQVASLTSKMNGMIMHHEMCSTPERS